MLFRAARACAPPARSPPILLECARTARATARACAAAIAFTRIAGLARRGRRASKGILEEDHGRRDAGQQQRYARVLLGKGDEKISAGRATSSSTMPYGREGFRFRQCFL